VNNSTLRMWFCGGNGTGVTRGDSIWYSESANYGVSGSWSSPIEVIRPSNNYSYLDYVHACDPSVVRHGDNYYIFYTGAPDWTPSNPKACDIPNTSEDESLTNPKGCDNRIFVARVPVASPSASGAYQKLVNVGECVDAACFQWRPFWNGTQTEYPPVPVVRYEIGSVWRKIGTGVTGYTTQQTPRYGIGQPAL
jgi:hypothetical protein